MENAHEQAIMSASAGLNRVAIKMGAEVIALLDAVGAQVKITYFWSRSQNDAPERRFLESRRLPIDTVGAAVTALGAGNALAELLSGSISKHSQSFLLFPWQSGSKVMTGVIGFGAPKAPVGQVPEPLLESLYFLGWANWSAKEIARLRGELRTVNERLASRKLVERAKSTLQAEQSMSEEQAYEFLRSLSRKRRITLAALSAEILAGHAVLPADSRSRA